MLELCAPLRRQDAWPSRLYRRIDAQALDPRWQSIQAVTSRLSGVSAKSETEATFSSDLPITSGTPGAGGGRGIDEGA
jgi:hypothetical protein